MEVAANPRVRTTLIATDKERAPVKNLSISRLPTFIVFRNGQVVGRYEYDPREDKTKVPGRLATLLENLR
jgi:hypothetical protein